MVMLKGGINRTRTLFKEDMYKCQAGTGISTAKESDTGLETEDSDTLITPTIVLTDKSIQVTHTIPSTTGSGNAYSEQETQLDSGNTSANRIVHSPQTKGANDEFIYITNFYFDSV